MEDILTKAFLVIFTLIVVNLLVLLLGSNSEKETYSDMFAEGVRKLFTIAFYALILLTLSFVVLAITSLL